MYKNLLLGSEGMLSNCTHYREFRAGPHLAPAPACTLRVHVHQRAHQTQTLPSTTICQPRFSRSL